MGLAVQIPLEIQYQPIDTVQNRFPIYHDPSNGLNYVSIEYPAPALPRNKVVSLFSGAGGFDVGLEMAGFETVGCVEIDADCRATLAHNRPDWHLILGKNGDGDIRAISGTHILEVAGVQAGEIALVVGGPPCQPFSNIGKKQGVEDPNNGDLHYEYVRLVKELQPDGFILENVDALLQKKHAPLLAYILHELSEAGYTLDYTILNAVDYGVPQQRRRFILMGVRGEQRPLLPLPTRFQDIKARRNFFNRIGGVSDTRFEGWQTVGEALAQIPSDHNTRKDYVVMNISQVVQERMKLIAPGENFHVLPMDMRPNCWKNGKHQGRDTFGRLRLDKPSLTIRTAAYNPAKGMYIHPTENRGLNSHEMAALQSFPSEWIFKCVKREKVTLVSVGKQIGNAVPPLLAKALGEAMKIALTE